MTAAGLLESGLVGDVGGTNLRLAVNDGGRLGGCLYQVADDLPDLETGLAVYVERTGVRPRVACLAVAGPVLGDEVRITNRGWRFSIEAVQRRFGLERLIVINDFQALATALPALTGADLVPVGGGTAIAGRPMTVLGPGTGLGVAGLLPLGDGWTPVPGEAGHTAFAAATAREWALVAALAPRFGGRISNERLLSGSGLALIHEGLALVDGVAAPALAADAITRQGLDGSCARCRDTLDFFLGALGSFAGDMALTFAAVGGAFIGGGIVPRLVDLLPQSSFRARFEAKGPEVPFVRHVPSQVIVTPDATLTGALRHLIGHLG